MMTTYVTVMIRADATLDQVVNDVEESLRTRFHEEPSDIGRRFGMQTDLVDVHITEADDPDPDDQPFCEYNYYAAIRARRHEDVDAAMRERDLVGQLLFDQLRALGRYSLLLVSNESTVLSKYDPEVKR